MALLYIAAPLTYFCGHWSDINEIILSYLYGLDFVYFRFFPWIGFPLSEFCFYWSSLSTPNLYWHHCNQLSHWQHCTHLYHILSFWLKGLARSWGLDLVHFTKRIRPQFLASSSVVCLHIGHLQFWSYQVISLALGFCSNWRL